MVLGWLAHSNNKWRVFVSHRVQLIRDILPHTRWRHVQTSCNPADHASRGLLPRQIINCDLWWHGPPWLCLSPSHWPTLLNPPKLQSLPEAVARVNVIVDIPSPAPPWNFFTSLRKAVRILFWCLCFIANCHLKVSADRLLDPVLSPIEISTTSILLVRLSQQESFPEEYAVLQRRRAIMKPANLAALQLFLAPDGLIRIGGRLGHSLLPSEQRHPILLHHRSGYAKLLVQDVHVNASHACPSTMMAILADSYHLLGARRLVKSHSSWKLTRHLSQEIWCMWKSTYLKSLNAHSMWKTSRPNLRVGDVVVVKDETLRQRSWPLALIVRTYPGKDNLVRVVDIRCHDKIFRRPIHKLEKLFSTEEDSRLQPPGEYVQVSPYLDEEATKLPS